MLHGEVSKPKHFNKREEEGLWTAKKKSVCTQVTYDNHTMTCVWRAYAKKGATNGRIIVKKHKIYLIEFYL